MKRADESADESSDESFIIFYIFFCDNYLLFFVDCIESSDMESIFVGWSIRHTYDSLHKSMY